MIGARNVKTGFALLALSLLGGLAMSLYAFVPMIRVPASLDEVDDLSRRLFRLAHVAAVMLPLLNIVVGFTLDRLRLSRGWKEWTSVLLLAGAVGLPLALAAQGLYRPAAEWHVAAAPAIAMTLGIMVAAVGALRTPAEDLIPAAARHRYWNNPS
jgi:hypothetical protein